MTFSANGSNFQVRIIKIQGILSKIYVTIYVNTHWNVLNFELERNIRKIKMYMPQESGSVGPSKKIINFM